MSGPSDKLPLKQVGSRSREVIAPSGHWARKGGAGAPHALKLGSSVYVGGQISLDRNGEVLGPDNIEIQTRNVFENLVTVLKAAGTGIEELIKLHTYYICGGDERATEYWERMTRVRLDYLSDPGPAATALRVSGIPTNDVLIGIDGIAMIGGDKRRIMPKRSWDWSMPTPFSQGWKIGNKLFVGGQISADKRGKATAVGDVQAQTQNILEFIRQVLLDGGASWNDLVTLKVCYKHSGSETESRALNAKVLELVRKTIPKPRPALTAFGVDLVYEGLVLEMDGFAVLGGKQEIAPSGLEAQNYFSGFTQAWKAGPEIYIGGVFAPGNGLQAQTKASLEKVRHILNQAGSDYQDLVKATIFFVTDRNDPTGSRGHQVIANVLAEYLPTPGPVTTLVRVPALPHEGQLFQIDGIAVSSES
jgi:enamine deaminase RidA (YjgF/YER057c/UK114 family)